MKIAYLGSGEFGVPCLEALKASRHDLSLVVTQPAQPSGRGRKPRPTRVAHWAETHAEPFLETANVNAPEVIEKIADSEPDVTVVIAFGQKIGKTLVDLPPKGAINVHASLLPKLRGAAPINWAIIRGETETGLSIITLAERMDAGDILAQCSTTIDVLETAGELHDRLAHMAAPLLLETLEKIDAGQATYTKQDERQASRAPKLKKSDGFLDFSHPAYVLADQIRGFWPWPGASARFVSTRTGKTTRVTLALAEVIWGTTAASSPPGTFDGDLNVVCGDGRLSIRKLKPAGAGLMTLGDFVNGWRVQPGDRFVKMEE
ncbi:MAG: methionyl-tRNA formyltransferase [Phycisphaerales bacterium]|nr:MAG: methionyl-tRNA formyltransferase [Phycisphaerales bacterium]